MPSSSVAKRVGNMKEGVVPQLIYRSLEVNGLARASASPIMAKVPSSSCITASRKPPIPSWEHQITDLAAADYRVVVPDLRGGGGPDCGHRALQEQPQSVSEALLAFVDSVEERQRNDKPFEWAW